MKSFNVLLFAVGFAFLIWFTKPETVQTTNIIGSLGMYLFGWLLFDLIMNVARKPDED
jgi:succinate-acetate transporter protein